MKVIFQGMINMLILGKIKGWGGVAVYVHTDLQHTLRPDMTINGNDIFELCIVELKINKTPIIAREIYHAPNSNEQTSLNELTLY